MRNFILIILGIIIVPVLMVLITPFALPIFFIMGACAAVSLILDIIQRILTKKFN
jgi:hypothetical protein